MKKEKKHPKKISLRNFLRLRSGQVQDIQSEIFRKMSADKKIELGSQLWQLAKELVGDKINKLCPV